MSSLKKTIAFLSVSILVLVSSCYYDNYEELYPAPFGISTCDTTGTISYSAAISKIFADNCNGCHSTSAANGNIVLDNYNSVISVVNSGKLIPAIEQTGPFPMPPGGVKLSDCKINQVKIWISQGSLNN